MMLEIEFNNWFRVTCIIEGWVVFIYSLYER
uniref:Uncharacterized protein n=1 Tax=Rhizophora mucronata TaxID=61149 RepID=A0A2P2NI62_RHIMU